MRRSFSVPVNVKARSLRRADSARGLIRVISATSRVTSDDNASMEISPEIDTGQLAHFLAYLMEK